MSIRSLCVVGAMPHAATELRQLLTNEHHYGPLDRDRMENGHFGDNDPPTSLSSTSLIRPKQDTANYLTLTHHNHESGVNNSSLVEDDGGQPTSTDPQVLDGVAGKGDMVVSF